jgi:hypothetical protein
MVGDVGYGTGGDVRGGGVEARTTLRLRLLTAYFGFTYAERFSFARRDSDDAALRDSLLVRAVAIAVPGARKRDHKATLLFMYVRCLPPE